ncbi:MAG: hypothetical protein IPK10_10875 [Bacteroidetes bacterium]|nr:hypothetical protein [Bacteroidota bacterium]
MHKPFGQQSSFQRIYKLAGPSIGIAVKELPNQNYIVGLHYSSIASLPNRMTIMKINEYGDSLNAIVLCASVTGDIAVSKNFNVAIIGTASSCIPNVQTDIVLYLMDTTFNMLDTALFGDANLDKGKRIINNSDGSYTIACYNNSYPDLLKVDSSGNIIWSRSYGLSGLYSVKHSLDGGYFICGNAGGGFVDPMYVAKLDSMGFVIWYKTFYNSGMFIFTDIEPTPDGGVVALTDFAQLYKISATGDSLWKRTGLIGTNRIITSSDGNLILSGGGMSISKIDTGGTTLWSYLYSYYPFTVGIGYESNDVIQTSDGGYMLCGLIDSFGVQNLYVVKTDSLGLVTTGLFEVENQLLRSYCYPNPMLQTTQITFSDINLPELKNNNIRLYDSRGVLMREEDITLLAACNSSKQCTSRILLLYHLQ